MKSNVDKRDARKHLGFNLIRISPELSIDQITIPLINCFKIFNNRVSIAVRQDNYNIHNSIVVQGHELELATKRDLKCLL